MNIQNADNKSFNFEKDLQPLFDAMKDGKIIKSVTCCDGEINRNNPQKDFTIKRFIATDYYVGMMSNFDGSKHFDLVDVSFFNDEGLAKKGERMFYMTWVKNFEL